MVLGAEMIAGEAVKTIVGTGAAYIIGKFLGKKEARRVEKLRNRMCNLLWKMEFEVSPKLLPEVVRSEVEMGCIRPEEMDDRLKKVMDIRSRYGLMGGANAFLSPSGVVSLTSQSVSVPKVDQAKIEELQAKAMREAGPPLSDTEIKTDGGR